MKFPHLIKLHEKQRKCQPLPKENYEALWRWIRMRFSHLSNNFEGNTLTYSETCLLLINCILMRLDFLPVILSDREEYIKAVEFSDVGDRSRLEKLFADNIASALERGILAETRKISLNDFLFKKSAE